MNDSKYLHGFSSSEQQRLLTQARHAESQVFRDIDFYGVDRLLEVGMGVGAQSEILLRRFPEIYITGIEMSPVQINTAKNYLNNVPWAKGRFDILEMDASEMELKSSSLDGAFLCWILEHVADPPKVLSEVRRVLRKGSPVVITEVMNHSFFLDPYSSHIWNYWKAFNDYQLEHAGDPYIGARLGNLLMAQGFEQIETKIRTWHLDNRNPGLRKLHVDFWTDLLLSGSKTLIDAKYIDEDSVAMAEKDLKSIARDPNAIFFYSFMQAQARV